MTTLIEIIKQFLIKQFLKWLNSRLAKLEYKVEKTAEKINQLEPIDEDYPHG